jgi:spore germination cell wall hydrolase CwlJ-like protein
MVPPGIFRLFSHFDNSHFLVIFLISFVNLHWLARKSADQAGGSCSAAHPANCSDEDLLTAVCIGEAGSIKDRDGKKGVMNVVRNRVADGAFPGNIRSVVTQPNQFTGLSMGLKRLHDPAFAQCRELAQEVMKNPQDDPTRGAIFFDQNCSRPCTQYCTTYLGDGRTRAHYFARRATKEEQDACQQTAKKREDHCCLTPRQRSTD